MCERNATLAQQRNSSEGWLRNCGDSLLNYAKPSRSAWVARELSKLSSEFPPEFPPKFPLQSPAYSGLSPLSGIAIVREAFRLTASRASLVTVRLTRKRLRLILVLSTEPAPRNLPPGFSGGIALAGQFEPMRRVAPPATPLSGIAIVREAFRLTASRVELACVTVRLTRKRLDRRCGQSSFSVVTEPATALESSTGLVHRAPTAAPADRPAKQQPLLDNAAEIGLVDARANASHS